MVVWVYAQINRRMEFVFASHSFDVWESWSLEGSLDECRLVNCRNSSVSLRNENSDVKFWSMCKCENNVAGGFGGASGDIGDGRRRWYYTLDRLNQTKRKETESLRLWVSSLFGYFYILRIYTCQPFFVFPNGVALSNSYQARPFFFLICNSYCFYPFLFCFWFGLLSCSLWLLFVFGSGRDEMNLKNILCVLVLWNRCCMCIVLLYIWIYAFQITSLLN